MSQPPSLPKLTAFLRPGQQQQIPVGDDNSADKRRLAHHASPHPPQMYAHEDSELLHEAHRQKRRANMFVQYRDTEYHPSQQQHQPLQRSGDYDPRLHGPPQQHSFLPPPNAQVMGQYAQAPSLADHQRQPPPPFREFTGNTYGAPMATQDMHHAHTVKNEMPPPSAPPEPIQRERKSRYLSESDRRSIITRIDHGEKQVALAKEYQVSRAAICNLYKNRKEVLTRAERDAKPKQAKRAKSPSEEKHTPGESRGATATASEASAEEKGISDRDDDAMSDDNISSTDSNDTNPATAVGSSSPSIATHHEAGGSPVHAVPVYDASSSSYPIRGLVSELRNAQLPQATLRQVTSRLVRCLLEETLACLPRREANVMTSAGDPFVCLQPFDVDQIYAISMESQGSIMLQALLDILPSAATTLVSTTRQKDSLREEWVVNCHRLPQIPDNTSVLLLAMDCATGTQLVNVLTYLVNEAHVKQSNIYVAIVISSEPGLALVHERFPGVTVVSAAIDHGLDEQGRIRPGLGNLMERFLHLDVSERSRS